MQKWKALKKVALVFLHILALDTNYNKVEDLLVFAKF